MNVLVGYTGFVGSNIYVKGKFDKVFNSKNITEAYDLKPELLIYAGVRAEKYLANNAPKEDEKLIQQAMENIERIKPQKLVLISTVDVYKHPVEADENTQIDEEELQPYGKNRYQLECMVREKYQDALIVRLPGLFGENIKKNFIYDFIHGTPSMLKKEKFLELAEEVPEIGEFYVDMENGFYKCREISKTEEIMLRNMFETVGFSALNFTDSRSAFQFYPLSRLWDDIQVALKKEIILWNPATEPVLAGELYEYITGEKFVNELQAEPLNYNYKTLYSQVFGGKDGYIINKTCIMQQIKDFVEENS